VNQVGFFRVIVIPLITTWVNAFPSCSQLLEQAKSNYKYWQAMSKREKDMKIVDVDV